MFHREMDGFEPYVKTADIPLRLRRSHRLGPGLHSSRSFALSTKASLDQ